MLISLVLATTLLASQTPDGRDLASSREVEELPRIDGMLSEPLWQSATDITDFVQSEPRAGEPATERTEVRILYTRDVLLIGARLFDTEPDRIVGTEYRRDALLEAEDSFEIFFDTFRDGRNAFYFATNPVGARLDGVMSNEGAVQNFEWDGVWQAAATIDEAGWTVEIAIPFNTLRFVPGSIEGWVSISAGASRASARRLIGPSSLRNGGSTRSFARRAMVSSQGSSGRGPAAGSS